MKILRLRRLFVRCREKIRPRAWLLLLPAVLLLGTARAAKNLRPPRPRACQQPPRAATTPRQAPKQPEHGPR